MAISFGQFSNPVHQSGHDRVTEIADRYGRTPQQILSKIQSNSNLQIDNFMSLLGKSEKLFGGLVKIADKLGFKLPESISNLSNRLSPFIKQSIASVHEFSAKIKDNALSALSAIGGGDLAKYAKSLTYMGDKVINLINTSDFSSVSGLLAAGEKIFGKEFLGNFIDIQAEIALISSIVKEAMSWGIPELINEAKNFVSNLGHLKSTIASQFGIPIKRGDIDTLYFSSKILDGKAILLKYPTAIEDILKNYKLPRPFDFEKLSEYETRLVDTLTAINPKWDKDIVGGEEVISLRPFQYLGLGARTIFMASEKYKDVCIVANTYRTKPLPNLVRENYPYLKLKFKYA